ncbi:LysE family translocator [Bradyrhizobium cenepequi]|uniref:LysE family translocator n=1 Tax=Bradyrhizobium cenepequi TaxID=2821403 RepID=UPI001CE37ECA|nr:LysE family transporter [Bradyrhizobium cenepequi]MCA6106186.1 LysE family transporter [Bradyrhizobium cenepequi]
MTPFVTHLLPAVALGLCVAIPFGPIGLMCVQRTLAFGIWTGIASGIGAATAHGMFSSLAAVSGTVLTQMTLALHTPLRITGGIVLVLMGLRTILVSTQAAHGATCGDATCGDLLSAYTSTLLIAAANPMTILPYLGVTSALEAGEPLIMDRALATPVGVMLGSASWYLFLVLSTNTMFRRLRKTVLDWFNRLTGILLMALGASLCARFV